MKIIVMGAGKVGQVLCSELSKEDHDITLIETDDIVLQEMLDSHDINGILGNGASYDIQVEAGVENADVFIAVTDDDELNMIASVLSKKVGVKKTIARVRKQEYSDLSEIMRESLGISIVINPELQAAEYIKQLISFPQAMSYEYFMAKDATIVEIKIAENTHLVGKMLAEFRNIYKNVIVCGVLDATGVSIPRGNYSIKPGSHLYITGPHDELVKIFKENGQEQSKINSLLIIGGGLITRYVLTVLKDENLKIKVIEIDLEKAEHISRDFPEVEVIHDDGASMDALIEQRASNYDALLALTGIDEQNIIVSMVASKMGIQKTMTKINRTELLDLGDTVGLQSVVTPKRLIADDIVQKVRAMNNSTGSNVEALYTMADEEIEALQFRVRENSKVIDIKIRDLNINKGNLIAYIFRNGRVIFPTGNDEVKTNDRVIIITTNKKLKDLDEILL